MEPKTTLPLDILLYIIDILAGGDDEHIKSLQILSQTSKSMVPLCRKHLFSSLHLFDTLDSECFSDLLSKNPDIACYVRSLTYSVYNPITDHELNILDALRERSSLLSIKLRSLTTFDKVNLPESLVSLIQLPTVTHLDIEYFEGFPATALSGCSNLIDLQLGGLTLVLPKVNQVISRSKIPTPVSLYIKPKTYGLAGLLNSASLHTGGPIVDFSRLQKASFDVELRSDIDQVNELIKVKTRLEYLSISMVVNRPLKFAGLGTSLAINAYRTLKLLALAIKVNFELDLLWELSRELRFIAGNNILEELKLDVDVRGDTSCLTKSEGWSALDSVLTESGAFPMLHRVSVKIWWWYTGSENLDDCEATLESSKEDKFPRLLESKAVEFNFSNVVSWDWQQWSGIDDFD